MDGQTHGLTLLRMDISTGSLIGYPTQESFHIHLGITIRGASYREAVVLSEADMRHFSSVDVKALQGVAISDPLHGTRLSNKGHLTKEDMQHFSCGCQCAARRCIIRLGTRFPFLQLSSVKIERIE